MRTTVTFLGTAAVVPGAGHDTASFLINDRYLVDTGWYAAIKMQSYGVSPLDLDSVILTHCHHDHYLGLPQLLFYRSMRRRERPELSPLKVIGPADDLERVIGLSRQFLQEERFPDVAAAVELIPLRPGDTHEEAGFHLATVASLHPVPGLCYRFTDRRTGAVVVFTGDTAPDPPGLDTLARNAGLLIHEASFGPGPAPVANTSLHAGAPDAARLAARVGVERLALVHCPEEKQASALAAAQAIFPAAFWPDDGEVVSVG